MLACELTAIGPAEEVVKAVTMADPGQPGPGEVLVEMLACPINPADILGFEGNYAARPETPCRVGIEGAGRILAVGPGVRDLAAGQLVMSLARANWATRLKLNAPEVVALPAGTDPEQAAMLKVNAATAKLMLSDYVTLSAGDWVLQDSANSGVGRDVIKLARTQGLKTVNIVRRDGLATELQAIGADVVLVDGPDLADRVKAATGGASIRLALDAVAGSITERLGDCLADGGVIVNYGLLSGEPCSLRADQLVFKGVTLTGFWLAKMMRQMNREQIGKLYADLSELVRNGTLSVPIDGRYRLEDIGAALAHAKQGGRSGKILLTPNA